MKAHPSPGLNAVITDREDLAEALAIFRVRPAVDPVPFSPGQYVTLGLEVGGKLVQRPYSIASSALDLADGYELYVRLVPGGALTPHLFAAEVGRRVVLRPPKGRFALDPHDPRRYLFVASGCGIAPFISMLRTLHDAGTPHPTIVLHGVSFARELGYRSLLEDWERGGDDPLRYVPTVSRVGAPENASWAGRVGRVETLIDPVCDELRLRPEDTVAYLCGNPGMIQAAERALLERGFAPEQIRKELYWPIAKERRS